MDSAPSTVDLYARMNAHFGDLGWWPGETPFEVAVGAILTQNTVWTSVEKAIGNLKETGCLTPEGLFGLDEAGLAERIRPAGYFRVKARRLKAFLSFLHSRYDLSLERMFRQDAGTLRDELLSVHGIGEETADSILLYAGNRPVFVVDAYTRRILARHEWIDGSETYRAVRDVVVRGLPENVPLFKQYHALFVQTGKVFCRKAEPRCEGCPVDGLGPRRSGRKGEPDRA
ncbi:MAG: endonuclease III domain-containing protein [Syntrophaceae bacterium]|nr:endonuclease III domain-containing protein [Syntrophaceae bacterium]